MEKEKTLEEKVKEWEKEVAEKLERNEELTQEDYFKLFVIGVYKISEEVRREREQKKVEEAV
jgi:hypothetical protein